MRSVLVTIVRTFRPIIRGNQTGLFLATSLNWSLLWLLAQKCLGSNLPFDGHSDIAEHGIRHN